MTYMNTDYIISLYSQLIQAQADNFSNLILGILAFNVVLFLSYIGWQYSTLKTKIKSISIEIFKEQEANFSKKIDSELDAKISASSEKFISEMTKRMNDAEDSLVYQYAEICRVFSLTATQNDLYMRACAWLMHALDGYLRAKNDWAIGVSVDGLISNLNCLNLENAKVSFIETDYTNFKRCIDQFEELKSGISETLSQKKMQISKLLKQKKSELISLDSV